ncbi:MAG: SpoIIE family protein phosphatase [Flavobacteriales bacterium]|nr:SpoIIE family protein phosphatase [Flavobacteriales bacterium]
MVQKNLIEEKNRDIVDSIRYARRIQKAILPNDRVVKELLDNSFILYLPKDIVSGYFYWVAKTKNKILFAAVDCTDHGVPGAFMSIVGNTILNEAVNEKGLDSPAEILEYVDVKINETLRDENEMFSINDGMDMALCALDRQRNVLEFAGAYNPLYIVRDSELTETKGSKRSLGAKDDSKQFENHQFEVKKDDVIFVFFDGFADQFGGEKGKKFKYKQFKELLVKIQEHSMNNQGKLLEKRFNSWKNDLDQLDDVVVVGVKV